MLDKTIPYYRVIMQRKAGTPIPEPALPADFAFVSCTAGDEKEWAEIEASVGEFPRAVDALLYFQQEYLPYLRELERRTLFVQRENGEKVATLTDWWAYTGERRDPWLHWIAVKPGCQGLGLGKAIVFEGMRRMLLIEGDRDVFLPTQTWSYKAIGIYRQAGFGFDAEPGAGGFTNEYELARPILQEKLAFR